MNKYKLKYFYPDHLNLPKLLDLTNTVHVLDKILVKAMKGASLCVVVEGAALQEIHSNFLKTLSKEPEFSWSCSL